MILVSPANKIGTEVLFMMFCKSFICTKNNRGPMPVPCGTLIYFRPFGSYKIMKCSVI